MKSVTAPRRRAPWAVAALALVALASAGHGEDRPEAVGAAARVKEKVLANGLRVLVLERRGAPVIAFATVVHVGAVDEPRGATGVAHVFEHMAFKGSTTIGTKDHEKEKAALDEVEDVFAKLRAARRKNDTTEVQKLEKAFEEAKTRADAFVVSEEYSTLIQRNGGAGLNAWTAADCTCYHVELPSNRLELFLALEADRFARPVLREFYKEKEAVKEERRLRTESSPQGRLLEEFLAIAYKAHPYGQPTIGHVSDLDNLSAREAAEFYKRYYTPNNTTLAIAGDVSAEEAFALCEKHLGKLVRGPTPPPVHTLEPEPDGEKRVVIEAKAQPVVFLGWHRPSASDKDNAVYGAIGDVLATGRASRLYKALVLERKVAVSVEAFASFPGERFPNLLGVAATPAPGKTTEDCVRAIDLETARVAKDLVEEAELESVKVRARASLIRGFRSLDGMAQALAVGQATYGDWREVFAQADRIAKVSREDVKRVAAKLFQKKNRVRGDLVAPEEEAKPAPAKGDEKPGAEPGKKPAAPKSDEDGEDD